MPSVSQSVDFVNLMTYDMHGAGWEPNTADHHAPLYKRSWDTSNLYADYAVTYWIGKGLPASKLNMGIPLYGQSWTLSTSSTKPPAPASGAGSAGAYTQSAGMLAYYEICSAVRSSGWTVTRDPNNLNGPYAVSSGSSSKTWVGYDDPAMATVKANYVLSKGLGGAIVWDISMDDFGNLCATNANPVMTAISQTLRGNSPATTTTTPGSVTTTTTTTTLAPVTTTKSSNTCK